MGGPTVAIALEELAHMGADTFIRVGSCGVFQDDQKPGDVIIASGSVRGGGTASAYLPLMFPAVPTFSILRALVRAAEGMRIPHTVGVGIAGDAFYGPRDPKSRQLLIDAGVVSVEMESDTLFIMGMFRRWRTGALFASDGTPTEVKPEWGMQAFRQGEENAIKIALDAIARIAAEE
jgi:uridine phosphorylase